MAFCDCHRQSFQFLAGTLRQSGWRLGLPGGSSSSTPPTVIVRGWSCGSSPVRSSGWFIVYGSLQLDSDIQCPSPHASCPDSAAETLHHSTHTTLMYPNYNPDLKQNRKNFSKLFDRAKWARTAWRVSRVFFQAKRECGTAR